ncbi:MAG TPA: PspC domain-containing protein [Chloroflexaceae bacterium]|nr:PspC domain-containing protein [Chloroflexaceae bacterium]
METKRITRSRSNRMIAGVAGGLASYFGIDPMFVRIGFVVLALINGFGALLYFVLWLIVPNEGSLAEGRSNVQDAVAEMQVMVEELVARVRAAFSR